MLLLQLRHSQHLQQQQQVAALAALAAALAAAIHADCSCKSALDNPWAPETTQSVPLRKRFKTYTFHLPAVEIASSSHPGKACRKRQKCCRLTVRQVYWLPAGCTQAAARQLIDNLQAACWLPTGPRKNKKCFHYCSGSSSSTATISNTIDNIFFYVASLFCCLSRNHSVNTRVKHCSVR